MMNDLEKEIMENGIHYTLVGDYYFPTCTLADSTPVIGKWADLYERYLREKHPSEYVRLVWSNELNAMLVSIQNSCKEQVERLVQQMTEHEGITEQLKSTDPMEWVRRMNCIRNQAEEIVINELTK